MDSTPELPSYHLREDGGAHQCDYVCYTRCMKYTKDSKWGVCTDSIPFQQFGPSQECQGVGEHSLSIHIHHLGFSCGITFESFRKRTVYFSLFYCSVTKSCPILCDPMNCSTPGFPVLHHLPEFAQTCPLSHEDIQPSHPLLPPSPPALNLSRHQGLFQWACIWCTLPYCGMQDL